jgi:hypothetical protein
MKYTYAWSELTSQNRTLKLVTFSLFVITLILSLVSLKMSFKEALIIDRGCYSNALNTSKAERSLSEIESFIKLAVSERFDTDSSFNKGFISSDEKKLKDQEQKDFLARNIKQKVIVNSVTQTKEGFLVNSDRLISVGDVRSAFKFTLIVQIDTQKRSELNPYGLVLTSTQTFNDKLKKDDK